MAGHTAVSRAVAEHYREHLGLEGVRYIPNAFETRRLTPNPQLDRDAVRRQYALPGSSGESGAFLLVMPARLVPEKGHRLALSALEELRRRNRRVHLLIVGDGPERDDLEKVIAARALDENVTLLAPLTHQALFRCCKAVTPTCRRPPSRASGWRWPKQWRWACPLSPAIFPA
jgi:glycosyltransferase involved in cell wall biosynthesis